MPMNGCGSGCTAAEPGSTGELVAMDEGTQTRWTVGEETCASDGLAVWVFKSERHDSLHCVCLQGY